MFSSPVVGSPIVLAQGFSPAHLALAQHPVLPPARARIQPGRCDQPAIYNLPAQRVDETTRAIAHATGCFTR